MMTDITDEVVRTALFKRLIKMGWLCKSPEVETLPQGGVRIGTVDYTPEGEIKMRHLQKLLNELGLLNAHWGGEGEALFQLLRVMPCEARN